MSTTTPCLMYFTQGKCIDSHCKRNHNFNLKKVRRGICVYHFSPSLTCPFGSRCMYTHEIPPEVATDVRIIDELQKKKVEIMSKKQRATVKQIAPLSKASGSPNINNKNGGYYSVPSTNPKCQHEISSPQKQQEQKQHQQQQKQQMQTQQQGMSMTSNLIDGHEILRKARKCTKLITLFWN